jgi:hypothetical protein
MFFSLTFFFSLSFFLSFFSSFLICWCTQVGNMLLVLFEYLLTIYLTLLLENFKFTPFLVKFTPWSCLSCS